MKQAAISFHGMWRRFYLPNMCLDAEMVKVVLLWAFNCNSLNESRENLIGSADSQKNFSQVSVLSVGYLLNIHQFRLSEKYFTMNVFQLLRRKIDLNKILNEFTSFPACSPFTSTFSKKHAWEGFEPMRSDHREVIAPLIFHRFCPKAMLISKLHIHGYFFSPQFFFWVRRRWTNFSTARSLEKVWMELELNLLVQTNTTALHST